MKVVFEKLPQSLEEMKACSYGALTRPEYAPALFLCAMIVYPQNKEEALKMVEYLKGPEGLSEYEKQFLKDRMQGQEYVPYSFFAGASVKNHYTPSLPYTLEFQTVPTSFPDDTHATLYIHSAGADSPRNASMRLKPSTGQWFLSQQMLLANIRIPEDIDPWA